MVAVRSIEEWVEALIQGTLNMHQLPASVSPKQAATIRRLALERITHTSLSSIGDFSFDPRPAKCENLIGAIQVPVGIAGPLLIQGQHVKPQERVFLPLATTEGALIASINRGCSALHAAGGAIVRVRDMGISRAPVFRTTGIEQTEYFLAWVSEHFEDIAQYCEQGSRYLKLLDITSAVVGTSVYLRFCFHCADAMGMNMATLACAHAIEHLIVPSTGVCCVSVSGNYCTDKKPSAVNFVLGRGKDIHAEAHLSADIVQHILKTEPDAMVEVQYRKNLLGSIMAGAHGFNAHHANVLAALFIATGQDLGHIAESAGGVTCLEARDKGALYASVLLRDVPLGTVGGGTGLSTQREALALLGIVAGRREPGEDCLRLAEIIGAAVLAAELSIIAALAGHHLADAHQQLGR
ncbi:3-hydroxy-3-methylglutaryl-CoA reductase [Pseudomonas palleroniana]|uniref:hydroxymethylglutaryl-CoA reductase (NADPH) n=1 Tax=Pseudomonas palleroniana TaxID=191390 RepID=A0A1H5HYU6_9PSED|nr:hydroxymethylglutaryl-CoA reductase [Pseudomonas palleroniana]KAB0565703.1 hydroxymethylglutaryl-CoA reductase [Pseudomonas palleroniana]PTC31963.1 3-hydroxy-3-methylglutaryl-CoA reductase [Pseudomonas palleroniana]SEE33000.1 3-hydroxy-3-methylglutaryl-coenzyme A reductase [Pseudomonas palleroniana]